MNDEIRIIPITTKKGLKTFIQFHYDLYRGHKFAIPFLRFDEMNTLDPKKNPAFEFCEAQYFLAVDSEARIVQPSCQRRVEQEAGSLRLVRFRG